MKTILAYGVVAAVLAILDKPDTASGVSSRKRGTQTYGSWEHGTLKLEHASAADLLSIVPTPPAFARVTRPFHIYFPHTPLPAKKPTVWLQESRAVECDAPFFAQVTGTDGCVASR